MKIKSTERMNFSSDKPDIYDYSIKEKLPVSKQMIFHKYLLFTVRPITAFAISVVILLESSILCIGLVSGFFALLAILICIDGCILHFTKKVAN